MTKRTTARIQTMRVAFCGMMCALSVVLMLMGGLIPVMLYVAPLLAGILLLPVLAAGSLRRRGFPLAVAGLAMGLAEVGRRRSRGCEVFGPSSALWAPAWVLERSVAVWAALALRFAGGVPYAGRQLRTAAHSERFLRRRLNDRRNELSLAGAFRPAPQTVSTHTEPLRSLPQ